MARSAPYKAGADPVLVSHGRGLPSHCGARGLLFFSSVQFRLARALSCAGCA